ncbi:MAG: transposase [Marinifilaceae bacterium]
MKRRWTLEEKLSILAEAENGNVVEVCRKNNISTGSFYNWKKKFETKGEEGLRIKYDTRSSEMKKAEEKIRILQKLLAEREIELEVQREMLKKKFGTDDPRKI